MHVGPPDTEEMLTMVLVAPRADAAADSGPLQSWPEPTKQRARRIAAEPKRCERGGRREREREREKGEWREGEAKAETERETDRHRERQIHKDETDKERDRQRERETWQRWTIETKFVRSNVSTSVAVSAGGMASEQRRAKIE